MKVVKQEKLFLEERGLQKTYEIDICEVHGSEYVVNVRYGEVGTVLREGTKTVFPVSYDRALKVSNELVLKKQEKGYRKIAVQSQQRTSQNQNNSSSNRNSSGGFFSGLFGSTTKSPKMQSFKASSQKESILQRLEAETQGTVYHTWKLSRVIWKAGELNIKEAAPYIVQLANKNTDTLYEYSVCWALGRLKYGEGSLIVLKDFYEKGNKALKRIAGEAVLENMSDEESKEAIQSIIPSLPEQLQTFTQNTEEINKDELLHSIFYSLDTEDEADFLYTLYIISKINPVIRWALLSFFKEAPITGNLVPVFRYLLKISEFRQDAQFHTLLLIRAYEKDWGRKTSKEYVHRRGLRTIANKVQEGATVYTDWATELLLNYKGKELDNTYESLRHLAKFYVLYGGAGDWLLYKSATQYRWENPLMNWSWQGSKHCWSLTTTNDSLRGNRTEANPEAWNESKESTTRLLLACEDEEILVFAARIFFQNQHWYEHATTSFVFSLLAKNNDASCLLAVDIAKSLYDPANPDTELLKGLLETPFIPAQQLALDWIKANPIKFLVNWEILHYLLISPSEELSTWVKQSVPIYLKMIPNQVQEKALAKTLFLLNGDPNVLSGMAQKYWANEKDANEKLLVPIVDKLLSCFSEKLFNLSLDPILALIQHSFESVQYLGAEIIINHQNFNKELPQDVLESLLTSQYEKVRSVAVRWLNTQDTSSLYSYKATLWKYSLEGESELRTYLVNLHQYINNDRDEYLKELVEYLLLHTTDEQADECLLHYFQKENYQEQTQKVSVELFENWLKSSLEPRQLFAVNSLISHPNIPTQLPPHYLEMALGSSHASVRKEGLQLLSLLSFDELLLQKEAIIKLCFSLLEGIKEGISTVLEKLSTSESFGQYAINELGQGLLRKEQTEGVHEHLFQLITKNLSNYYTAIEPKRMWKLLHSNYLVANDLGALILQQQDLGQIRLKTLINLTNHQVVSIRQTIWNYLIQDVNRARYEVEQALRILDSDWEDSRNFGFQYFEEHFEKEHWTPELLISICDSVREDVQQFGRKLITRFFEEKAGETYLLHLSQHPNKDIQLMVTNYVEQFGGDNPKNLAELSPYFRTVLMGINKGRATKQRIFEFLHKEVLKSEEVAKLLLPLFVDLSLTVSIENKAKVIVILRDVQQKYPHLDNPLKIKNLPTT
ncbi:MAG: hypothetical protein GY827_09445 [Cytophagales bacterium]|nr:hypothetical protein [Cytophagales bacterium]